MRRWAAAIAAATLLAPASASGAQTRSQTFFRTKITAERSTTKPIRDLLGTGGGFVVKAIVFRDLTGDEKSDAIVRVHSGGAAGVVAVFVFSTDTGRRDDELRLVFSSQKLQRASTRVADDVLSYRSARYAAGDEPCCPEQLVESTLEWDAGDHRLKVAERTVMDGPAPPSAAGGR